MVDHNRLRPLERRVLHLADSGIDEAEIGRRFGRSPEFAQRVIELAGVPRVGTVAPRGPELRPLERRILRWRETGAAYGDIAPRFRRSPAFVERVEGFARYKLDR